MYKENELEIIESNRDKETNNSEKNNMGLYLVLVSALVAVIVFMVVAVNNHLKTNTSTISENNTISDYYQEDMDETKITESYSSNKSAEEIIQVYNDRIRKEDPSRSQDIINSLIMSYARQEYDANLDVTSYEYAVPSNIIGAYIFENADGKANFGGIEINTAVPGGTDESTLSMFMNLCYYFAYGFDTSMTEDDFMGIWRNMRNNADHITIYSDVTYQIQENGQYLSFNIKYDD